MDSFTEPACSWMCWPTFWQTRGPEQCLQLTFPASCSTSHLASCFMHWFTDVFFRTFASGLHCPEVPMVCALAATILAAWTSMLPRAQRHASRSVCIGKFPKFFLLMTFTTWVFHVCQKHFMNSETSTTRLHLLANRNPCAIFPTCLRVRCATFESSKLGPVQLKTGVHFGTLILLSLKTLFLLWPRMGGPFWSPILGAHGSGLCDRTWGLWHTVSEQHLCQQNI